MHPFGRSLDLWCGSGTGGVDLAARCCVEPWSRGAVEPARSLAARVLEGCPVDVAAKATVSAAELCHGSRSLFEAAGFEVVSRLSAGRAVVRLALR